MEDFSKVIRGPQMIGDHAVGHGLDQEFPHSHSWVFGELKTKCVQNNVFGHLAIKWKLHEGIYAGPGYHHASNYLLKEIDRRVADRQPYVGLLIMKELGDQVEALLAALWMDSDFRMDKVYNFFEKQMLPFYKEHVLGQFSDALATSKLSRVPGPGQRTTSSTHGHQQNRPQGRGTQPRGHQGGPSTTTPRPDPATWF
ncbi:hypothetical protein BGZ83_001674 [Gryganskiella cystojenkinii]|nr:hypothetical protein BGZ83_001674 [Gryganskiella cystojenkinii]